MLATASLVGCGGTVVHAPSDAAVLDGAVIDALAVVDASGDDTPPAIDTPVVDTPPVVDADGRHDARVLRERDVDPTRDRHRTHPGPSHRRYGASGRIRPIGRERGRRLRSPVPLPTLSPSHGRGPHPTPVVAQRASQPVVRPREHQPPMRPRPGIPRVDEQVRRVQPPPVRAPRITRHPHARDGAARSRAARRDAAVRAPGDPRRGEGALRPHRVAGRVRPRRARGPRRRRHVAALQHPRNAVGVNSASVGGTGAASYGHSQEAPAHPVRRTVSV